MRKISNSAISVTRDERINSAPSSKGNQIKWRTGNGLWLKADDFGYERVGLRITRCRPRYRNSLTK